ncbi:integral membrane protein, YkoY family [Candidatus Bartonella washoeensis]|nr:integral membrane protein, YkoY family [Bartonella washoeensis]
MTFISVEAVGSLLDAPKTTLTPVAKGGAGAFLYLEVLDASFSFDGVVGAFAFSHNLFIIAIGLGIGAFYVRSMTIMLVEAGTLLHYRYLEHGAFYAILVLAVIMYLQTIISVPEVLTGLMGVCIIGMAFYSSLRFKRHHLSKHVVSK